MGMLRVPGHEARIARATVKKTFQKKCAEAVFLLYPEARGAHH